MNTALIAEYLALAPTLQIDSPRDDYQRANQLAFQLAMELDADLWRLVARAVAGGTANDIWQAILAAGEPGKINAALTASDVVVHTPHTDGLVRSQPEARALRH